MIGHQENKAKRRLLVSNRLPISISKTETGFDFIPSSGGVASGLSSLHAEADTLWIGWLDQVSELDESNRVLVEEEFQRRRLIGVDLPKPEADRFYEGFANGILWPVFHYLIDRIPLITEDWPAYVFANERFADVIANHASDGDTIWIHDYQLMLLPQLLRERLPTSRIGFFLHIPFPSSEVFRILPKNEALLRGLLGADLIGFHTFAYARHFTTSLLRVLGIEADIDQVSYGGRRVRIGVFPMGIDGSAFVDLANSEAVAKELSKLKEANEQKFLFGVDRLDYTKGLLQRMLAIERLFEREPSWRGHIQFVQLVVPSREHVKEYNQYRNDLELIVSRINGIYGTPQDTPIRYLYRSVTREELVAMYRAADVMLVTPLRDGMNLVAKEFLASRVDGDGVLMLSEFAGAVSELGEAVLINPYDVDGMAQALSLTLKMDEKERRSRMQVLRDRVLGRSVQDWAFGFVRALEAEGEEVHAIDLRRRTNLELLVEELVKAKQLVWLLDYDGTLIPIAERPERAAPDAALLELLDLLAQDPNGKVHLISGRGHATMDAWFGQMPVTLHAEHGLWERSPKDDWKQTVDAPADWKPIVLRALEEYVARTPGAFIEQKTSSLAWHYRAADRQLGALQARELRVHLIGLLAQQPATVLAGDKVIEVRPVSVSKAISVKSALEDFGGNAICVAIGDDRTDEDMFSAIPKEGISISVGPRSSSASHRIFGVDRVRELLRLVIEDRRKK